MENRRILFSICGSFYNHTVALEQLIALCKCNDVTAVASEDVYTCSTRFFDKDVFMGKTKDVTKHDIIHTIVEAEKIGPTNAYDIMVIAPMAAIAVIKMTYGIYDHPAILSAKATIRNQRNIVFGITTSDGLGIGGVNIFSLINTGHSYITPFRQDAPFSRERSTVSDWELMEQTIDQALNDRQLQLTLLGGRQTMKKLMVALATPFVRDNKVDYRSMGRILHRLSKEGYNGLIVCGTTVETSTLSHNKKLSTLHHVIKRVEHRAEIWCGYGSNNTATTILICGEAQKEVIDGVLFVTPYCSKSNAAGLYAHSDALASTADTNIMLYNVPARIGVELTYEMIRAPLEKHKNIMVLKQACSNLDMVRRLKQQHPDFLIYSGEDGFFGEGFDARMDRLVSIMGHVYTEELRTFCDDEHVDNRLCRRLYELIALTLTGASPAPVRYILHLQDECENVLRPPIAAVGEATENRIREYFTKYRHRSED